MSRTCIDCCVLSSRIIVLAAMLVTFAGCESPALRSPTSRAAVGVAVAASQSSERCVNVSAAGTASLGLVTLPNGTSRVRGNLVPGHTRRICAARWRLWLSAKKCPDRAVRCT